MTTPVVYRPWPWWVVALTASAPHDYTCCVQAMPQNLLIFQIQVIGQNGLGDLNVLGRQAVLINNPENEQVNMLVYCMGDNADDILLS
ncbi:hypothetical protein LAZ67_7002165 [Cordylochernes scorpioides]|uniref:Uncharacterized protein n=1 Tax=Cordylochernes scorpioides TaxID=51811 RepID=A0ABY6KN19_9ARAC|nr:hypothetical protein LAZ67_7002165 [Cordylochernes scorpioides]